jgi:hypothetical protein
MTAQRPNTLLVEHPRFDFRGLWLRAIIVGEPGPDRPWGSGSYDLPIPPLPLSSKTATNLYRGYVATFVLRDDASLELRSFHYDATGVGTEERSVGLVLAGDFWLVMDSAFDGPRAYVPFRQGHGIDDRSSWLEESSPEWGKRAPTPPPLIPASARPPASAPAALMAADRLQAAGRTEEACRAYATVADALAVEGRFLKAAQIWKRIHQLDPSRLDPYIRRADLYAKQGLRYEAERENEVLLDKYIKRGMMAEADGIVRALCPDISAFERKGVEDGERAVKQGHLVLLSADPGDAPPEGSLVFVCPACVETRIEPAPPLTCASCGTPRIPVRHLGKTAEMEHYCQGFNSAIRAHIRGQINPSFEWTPRTGS